MARLAYACLLLLTACASTGEGAPDAGATGAPPADGGRVADATTDGTTPPNAPTDGAAIDSPEADGAATSLDAAGPYPPRRTANEVLLVINSNSPTSTAIGDDYAQKRSVTNVVTVQCADSALSADNETIALADYSTLLAAPISAYLASHPSIDFIVLTKGIPIRINGADTGCCMNGDAPGQPSVDSFLAAIDYGAVSGAVQVAVNGSGTVGISWLNRYWNANVPFHHAQFGGYLVTRLDGYTEDDAKSLVTEALAAEQGPGSGPAMFDIDITHGLGDKTAAPEPITAFDYDGAMGVTAEWDWSVWNADMLHARDLMEASGIPNQLYMTGAFVGGASNLLSYFSWGSNDSNFDPSAYESLLFAPGSIGDTAVSTSGRTFLATSGGQSLVADLIAHGLTAAKGYVGEPLLQGVASPSIALARYHGGYSLAESMYAASRFVGWEDVILGDPLATPYYGTGPVVVPTYASTFASSAGGVQTETCSEGSMDVGYIGDGSYVVYPALPLASPGSFIARVASDGGGGTIDVRLDGASGTLLGSCVVPVTGNWETWTTVTCPLSPALGTGTHDLYLVFHGDADAGPYLFNLQWFAFRR